MPATLWPCTNEQYHADRSAISHSALDTFIESPPLYYGRYVLPPDSPGHIASKPSTAMLIGSAFHHLMLEPGVAAPFAVCPEHLLGKNGAKSTNAYRDFAAGAEALGKFVLSPEELDKIEAMREAALSVPVVRSLLECQGRPELSIKFECPHTSLPLKSRLDFLTETLIVDLKTCQIADPKEFAKSAYKFGYHRQAAFYQAAVESLTGDVLPIVFVAVEKEPPYTCEVFELSTQFVDLGARQNAAALGRLSESIKHGRWHTPTHGQIVTVSAPAWAFSDEQWSL